MAAYHFTIGKQRHIRHSINPLWHVYISPSPEPHLTLQHSLSAILHVLPIFPSKAELIFKIINVILILIASNSRAS